MAYFKWLVKQLIEKKAFEKIEVYEEKEALIQRLSAFYPQISIDKIQESVVESARIYILCIVSAAKGRVNIYTENDRLTLEDLLKNDVFD